MAESLLNPSLAAIPSPSEKLVLRVGLDLETSLDLFVGTFGSKAPEKLALKISYYLTDEETRQLVANLRTLKGFC